MLGLESDALLLLRKDLRVMASVFTKIPMLLPVTPRVPVRNIVPVELEIYLRQLVLMLECPSFLKSRAKSIWFWWQY